MTATFFGEVTELNSRAIWSDSEDDEENVEEKITTTTDVLVELKLNVDISCYDSVYFSLFKNNYQTVGNLKKIGQVNIQNEKDVFCNIYELDSKTLWFHINESNHILKTNLVKRAIRHMLRNIFDNIKNSVNVIIITMNEISLENSNDILCLTNSKDLLKKLNLINCKSYLAPSMLDNLIESSLFEYCTIFNIPVCAVKFSDNSFISNSHIKIPASIISNLKSLVHSSNIYI